MFSSSFFKKNRKNLSKLLKDQTLFVLFQKDQIIKGDSEYFSLCDVNLFYLTGIEQERTRLLISKDRQGKIIEKLFILKADLKYKLWVGEKLSIKKAQKISGIKEVYFLEEFETQFQLLLNKVKQVNILQENKYTQGQSEYELFIKKISRKKQTKDVTKKLSELRMIKSKEEIKVMKKAMKVTEKSFKTILKQRKTFKNEKDIEALLTYEYSYAHTKHAYHPIVAIGKNACTLHYIKNKMKLNKKQLLLVDSGAEYLNYKTDITRTFPLTKFTKRQKEVYEAVLSIQKFAIWQIKEGLSFKNWEISIAKKVWETLQNLKLTSKKEFDIDILRQFYPHSTGHFLGLDTHDLGDYTKPMRVGQVITVEPGIYIEKEKIGIRIEDNILIRRKNCEILSKAIPKNLKQLELL